MVNYELGKIYKIECRKTGQVYIGSTAQKLLSTRIGTHKGNYKKFTNNTSKKYCSSYEIIKNYDYFYDTIEYYECDSKFELEKRERIYIEQYKNDFGDLCVNKCIPTRTKKEYYLVNRENQLEQKKDYYQKNKDRIKERDKMANKTEEQRLEYNKKRREYRARKKAEAQALSSV